MSWVVEIKCFPSSLFKFKFMLWANICNSCFRKKPHIASLLLVLKVNEIHKGVIYKIYLFFLYHNLCTIEKRYKIMEIRRTHRGALKWKII